MQVTINIRNLGNKDNDYRRFQYSRMTPVILLVIGIYFRNKLISLNGLVNVIDHEIFF